MRWIVLASGRQLKWVWTLVFALCALSACKQEQASPDAADTAADAPASREKAQQAVSKQVAAMSIGELREAASKALLEQRLYAPAGNNALEYHVAWRDKAPNDAAAASALTDLMPYALIAVEQSIEHKDFSEAQRVYALMEQADPRMPALPRLRRAISEGQAILAKRTAEDDLASPEQLRAEPDAQAKLQPDPQRDKRRPKPEQADARPRAERKTDSDPASDAAQPGQDAPARATSLRAISTPSPSYPIDALRAQRTGELVVEFTVNQDGSVSNPRVVRATPPRTFDREVLRAVRRWRFEPVAEPITTRRTIEFKLD